MEFVLILRVLNVINHTKVLYQVSKFGSMYIEIHRQYKSKKKDNC